MKNFANQFADLLWKSVSKMSDFRRGPEAKAAHSRVVRKRIKQSREDGLVSESLWRGSELRAGIVLDFSFGKWVGLKSHRSLIVAWAPGDAAAKKWLIAKVGALIQENPELSFRLLLSGDQMRLRRGFEAKGLYFEDVYLVGDVASSFRALKRHLSKLRREKVLAESYVRLRDLETKSDVRQILALKKKVFQLQPHYSWFGFYPKYLASEKKELEDFLRLKGKKRRAKAKVIVLVDEENRIRGFGSAFFYKQTLSYRASAGMDFCFDASLQGLGLGSFVYLDLLQAMQERRIPIFTGHTSNPAIQRLGRITGRRAEQLLLTNAPQCPEIH